MDIGLAGSAQVSDSELGVIYNEELGLEFCTELRWGFKKEEGKNGEQNL